MRSGGALAPKPEPDACSKGTDGVFAAGALGALGQKYFPIVLEITDTTTFSAVLPLQVCLPCL
jgi:hypothetical protein